MIFRVLICLVIAEVVIGGLFAALFYSFYERIPDEKPTPDSPGSDSDAPAHSP